MKSLLLFIICYSTISAQISDKNIPRYAGSELSYNSIPTYTIAADPARITKLMQSFNKNYYISTVLDINIDPRVDGQWTDLSNGDRIWQCRISSPGAKALNIFYDEFKVPTQSYFHIYNESTNKEKGAYSSLNNNPVGNFVTDYIIGNTCVIEYYESKENKGEIPFVIREVGHFFRGVKSSKDFRQSTACMININCAEGNKWREQQKGVVRILTKDNQGLGWCTGTLMNNTSKNYRPYILTARHCTETSTKAEINQFIYYFNYESDKCTNPLSEPKEYTMIGSELRATNATSLDEGSSDFSLLELTHSIPTSFDVRFIGWDSKNNPGINGAVIHHPVGDIKKISTYLTPTLSSGWTVPTENSHWLVKYAATTNGKSVTEGGSSGAALYGNTGLVIGTLSGGEADCANASLEDYYGKMSSHWLPAGSDSAHQLKYWLDLTNSGIDTLGSTKCDTCAFVSDMHHITFDSEYNLVYNTDYFMIQTNIENFDIEMITLEGKVIKKLINQHSSIPYSLQEYNKGLYLIRIQNKNKIESFKLVHF